MIRRPGPLSVFFRRFSCRGTLASTLDSQHADLRLGSGIVLQEPSVVALDLERNATLAVGDEAKLMWATRPETFVLSDRSRRCDR